MAFEAPTNEIATPPPAATPPATPAAGFSAPGQDQGFTAPASDEGDAVTKAADDDKFDETDYYRKAGKTDSALDFAAKVKAARDAKPMDLKTAGHFVKGIWDEAGSTVNDVWESGKSVFTGKPHEMKSGLGSFGAGMGKVIGSAILPNEDPAGTSAGTYMSGDEWMRRTKERMENYDALLNDEQMQRDEWVKSGHKLPDFVSSIPKESVVTAEERAAYDNQAKKNLEASAAIHLGGMHGANLAIKGYRGLTEWGRDKWTPDQWKDRIRDDAEIRDTEDNIRQGILPDVERDNLKGMARLSAMITPPVSDEDRKRLIREGTYSPEAVEQMSGVADPTNLLLAEGLKLPIVSKAAGAALRLSGSGAKAVGSVVDKIAGHGAGKAAAYGLGALGTYEAGKAAMHGNFRPAGAVIGTALALFTARALLKGGGGLVDDAGRELLNPEGFNSASATKAASDLAGDAVKGDVPTTATGGALSNFWDASQNAAAASRVARRTIQGGAIGVAGALPFAALSDNPEQAGHAIGGGGAFGGALGPMGGIEPSLNRAMEINKAATAMLAERGGEQKFSDPGLQKAHDAAMADIPTGYRTYLNAMRGLVSGFKGRSGEPMKIALLQPADFGAEVAKRTGGDPKAAAENAHGFYDSASGTVFINKESLRSRTDAAGHETGHFITDEVMEQMGRAYGDALRTSVEKGLFNGDKATPEFQRFIDQYNKHTPGTPIPSDKGRAEILKHRGVSEYLAETTRNILGEPSLGRFMLPKDVSDMMADKAVAMFGDEAGEGPKQDIFKRTDLPTIHAALKDVMFDLGRGLTPPKRTARPAPTAGAGTPQGVPVATGSAQAATGPQTGGANPNPALPVNPAEPHADIGVSQDTLDSVRDYHISPPGMEPRTQRTNRRRGVEGRSADKIAEERGNDWDEMFRNYADFIRAQGMQAPTNPVELHQAVLQHALISDPVARAHADAVRSTPADPVPALAGESSIESKSPDSVEPRGALDPTAAPVREAAPAHTEQEISNRLLDAERQAEADPSFARKRTKGQAAAKKEARVTALLDIAGEASGGDQGLLQRRTDAGGQERFTGHLDPENILAHRMLLDELGVPEDGQATIELLNNHVGQTVYLDYKSAPKTAEGDITGAQRRAEYQESPADARKAGGAHTEQKGKAFHITGFKVWPGKGSITLTGFSPDKWIANASKLMDHVRAEGHEPGYTGVNDPHLATDMQGYSLNHANGWKGDGSAPVEGREPAPGYEPWEIPKDRFNLLNAALNFDISNKADSARPGARENAIEAQYRALENGVTPDEETGDVNPLRAYINKSGKLVSKNAKGALREGTGAHLESVYENISPDLVTGLSDAPGGRAIVRPVGYKGDPGFPVRKGIPRGDYTASGFMPGEAPSSKPFPGLPENADPSRIPAAKFIRPDHMVEPKSVREDWRENTHEYSVGAKPTESVKKVEEYRDWDTAKKYPVDTYIDTNILKDTGEPVDGWSKLNEAGVPELFNAPKDDAVMYRGMSGAEYKSAVGSGKIQSDSSMNLGDQVGRVTSFATDPSSARAYATGFAPWYMEPTFERPNYIVKVRRPEGAKFEQNSDNYIEHEGPLPTSDVLEAWEVRLAKQTPGVMEVRVDNHTGEARSGSAGPPFSHYVARKIAPGEGVDFMPNELKAVDDAARKAGYTIRAAHSTNAGDFHEFKTGGLSAHFGTEKAAMDRAAQLREFSEDVVGRKHDEARVMPVWLKIENPLRLPDLADLTMDGRGEIVPVEEAREAWLDKLSEEDRKAWDNPDDYEGDVRGDIMDEAGEYPHPMAWEDESHFAEVLRDKGIITTDEFWDVQYDKDAAVALLKEKGYDGIEYKNNVEGGGDDSYIVFDPNQIKSADEITKDSSGKEIPLKDRFDASKPDIRFMPNEGKGALEVAEPVKPGEDGILATSIKTKTPETSGEYPRIKKGQPVSGLVVRDEIPNRSSIRSSLTNPKILPGIRELRVSDFTDGNSSMMRSADTAKKVEKLAGEIKESGEINPLIVGITPGEAPYILEGSHRIEALAKNGVETFPALVAVEKVEHSVSKYGDGEKPYFVHREGDTNSKLSRHATAEEAWAAAEKLDGEFMPNEGSSSIKSKSEELKPARSISRILEDDHGVAVKDATPEQIEAAAKQRRKEGKNLIAVHNVSADKLDAAIDLGGVAVPSIAVVKKDAVHTSFGEISLIGDRRMIDPEVDPTSRVFEADIYSIRHPQPAHAIDTKAMKALVNEMRANIPAVARDSSAYEIEEWARKGREGNRERALEDARRSDLFKASFTEAHSGKKVEVKQIPEPLDDESISGTKAFRAYAKNNAGKFPDVFRDQGTPAYQELQDAIEAAWTETGKEHPMLQKVKNPYLDEGKKDSIELKESADPSEIGMKRTDVLQLLMHVEDANHLWEVLPKVLERRGVQDPVAAAEWIRDNAEVTTEEAAKRILPRADRLIADAKRLNNPKTVPDKWTARQEVDNYINDHRAEYNQWVQDKMDPLFDSPTLKGKGGKKVPYTLDNIVEAMSRRVIRGIENNMTASLGQSRARAAREFKSVDEMRAAQDQLVSSEEFEAARKEVDQKFNKATDSLLELGSTYHMGAFDTASEALGDYLVAGDKGAASMRQVLARRFGRSSGAIPEHAVSVFLDAARALKAMPTEYFESKLQRAVKFSDFRGAAVPNTAPTSVASKLRAHGIDVELYNPRDQGDRARVVERIAERTQANFMPNEKASVELGGKEVSTGKPVEFKFLRGKTSATSIFGIPDKESAFDRGYEPSGRYMTDFEGENPDPEKMETGTVKFKNPLVVPAGSYGDPSSWKRTLSNQFDGKTGKALSKAIIAAGHDGIVTVERARSGETYTGEIVDLTTFDESKAKYMPAKGAGALSGYKGEEPVRPRRLVGALAGQEDDE